MGENWAVKRGGWSGLVICAMAICVRVVQIFLFGGI